MNKRSRTQCFRAERGGPTKGRVKSMQFASFVRRKVWGWMDGRTMMTMSQQYHASRIHTQRPPCPHVSARIPFEVHFVDAVVGGGSPVYEMEFDTQTIELTTISASLHRFCREWFWSRLVLIELNSTGIYNLIIVIVSLFEWLEEGLRFLFRL